MNDTLFLARTVSLAALAEDGSVQMFPPGENLVTPSRADGKAPEELKLNIDAATADLLESVRAELQAKADAGQGDAPYFDFNHDDGEAAAWPKRIFWAGADPLTGGVRAEVEWSAAGDAAVKGKTFRRFSPVFFADGGRITGTTLNMGGLVNRAAFQRIAPLFAKQDTTDPNLQSNNTMTPEEITALQKENEALKAKSAEMQTKLDELLKKDATDTVELAAKEGRIGTAPELKAKWVESLIKDPSAAELLMAMVPNPALVTGTLLKGKAADADLTKDAAALLAKYDTFTDPSERSAFYAKHKDALKSARDMKLGQ